MSNPKLEGGAKAATDLVRIEAELVRSVFQLMRLLLEEGAPVSAEKVASGFRTSRDEVIGILKGLRARGAEFDEEDNFVGFGLTLIPTPHRYEVDGGSFYTWCADDAIFFPAWFGHTAVIESPDLISGEKVRLTVSPEGIESVEPTTAVVSRKYGGVDLENVRGTGCHYGHFFASRETASEYTALQAGLGLEVGTAEEAFRIGQIMSGQEPLKSILAR